MPWSTTELEGRVIDEFLAVEGREVLVWTLHAFGPDPDGGDWEDNQDIDFDPPIRAVVDAANNHYLGEDLINANGGTHLDPWYNVTLLEDRPELAEFCGFSIYGRSYKLATGEPDGDDDLGWTLAAP